MNKRLITLILAAALALLPVLSSCEREIPDETADTPADTAAVTDETAPAAPAEGIEALEQTFSRPLDGDAQAVVRKAGSRDKLLAAAEEYLSSLSADGWTLLDSRESGRLTFYCLSKDYTALHITVDKTAKTLRVVTDSAKRNVYSIDDKTRYTGTAELIQLANDHSTSDVGMGYVILLRDGTFAVIDGGHDCDADADLIWSVLKEKSRAEKPKISLWILSHAHGDHTGAFVRFASKYADKTELGALCANDARVFTPVNNEKQRTGNDALKKFTGALRLAPQTGDRITVGGVEFEFLYTCADYYPATPGCLNDTAMVFRVSAEKSALFLTDIQTDAAAFLAGMYGERLKSDIVQLAHHGYANGASDSVYGFVSADVCLWPSSSSLYENYKNKGPAAAAAKSAKQVYLAAGGNVSIPLD